MDLIGVVRLAHIASGVVALAAFWIPLAARKGGRVHRRAGWIYAVAMWAAAVAAWILCGARLLDENEANDGGAIFLAFVGLLAANGAGTGIRVLRTRSRPAEQRSSFDVGFSLLFVASSVALGGFGIIVGSLLYTAFAALGVVLSVGQLRYWLGHRPSKMEWWYTHMVNMLVACIGTVTAFLVVNVPRFGLERYGLYFWLGPGVVGGIVITLWTRYYRRLFDARSANSSVQESPPG